jgi:hypothetical protein
MSAFLIASSRALQLKPRNSVIGTRNCLHLPKQLAGFPQQRALQTSSCRLPLKCSSLSIVNRHHPRVRQVQRQIRLNGTQTIPIYNMPPHKQDHVQSSSLTDPETFWGHHAEHLYWHKKPSAVIQRTTKKLKGGTSHDHWTWFPDGEISTAYNCIDRHVNNGNGDHAAIIWDSPVTKSRQTYTYKQLLEEVETLAGVLREEGVKKGDVVLVYSKGALLND